MTAIVPERAASASGVQPPLPAAECAAPWRSSRLTASAWPSSVAAWTQPLATPLSWLPSDGSAPCFSSICHRHAARPHG
eukprot:5312942-Prymnesium_polylepis.2